MAKHVSPDLHKIRKLQRQNIGQSGPSLSGVASWNGRMGAVSLTTADLTALGVAFTASTVASFNTRTGAVTLLTADVTGVGGEVTTNKAIAGGYVGIDASNRLTISSGVSAPVTTAGGTALGLTAVVGWVGFNIGGSILKVPAFQ